VTIVQWVMMIFGAVTMFDLALFVLLLRSTPGERARKARRQAYLAWASEAR
jgi:hypothetical protein